MPRGGSIPPQAMPHNPNVPSAAGAPAPPYGGRVMPQQPGRVQPVVPGRNPGMNQGQAPMVPGGRVQPMGHPGMQNMRPSSPAIPTRPATGGGQGRRKTPPLGMPSQAPPQQSGQSSLPIGSKVLVYWNDGLWHSATIRQYTNGRYQVTIDGRNAMTWVQASQLRLP